MITRMALSSWFYFLPLSLSVLLGQQPDAPLTNKDALRLIVQTPRRQILGQPTSIVLSLKNLSAQPQTVPDLRTAEIEITVAQGNYRWQRHLGGVHAEERKMPDGKVLTKWVRSPEKSTTIPAGGSEELDLHLSSSFGAWFHTGGFKVTVSYQNQIEAEANFDIVISEVETVPALIGLIETNPSAASWARNNLYVLTGLPEWQPSLKYSRDELLEQARKSSEWWNTNKASLKLEHGRFVRAPQ